MFFRREKPRVLSFDEHLQSLTQQGFTVRQESPGRARVFRNGFAAVLRDTAEARPRLETAGLEIGEEVGLLTDLGYQKIFETPSRRRVPAQAEHLRALHDFTEDLKEALGLTSLYNEGLGTVNERHLYDRVQNRDRGVPERPWER